MGVGGPEVHGMNLLEEPSLHPGDNLDNLLRAYFQAEMPNPWPSMEAPAPGLSVAPGLPAPAKGRGSLFRSRLALAASITLLLAAPLFLGGKLRDTSAPGELRDGIPSAGTLDPRGPKKYRSSEGLIQKSDGTYIQIDIFELPASK